MRWFIYMKEFFKNIKFVWKYAKSEKRRIIIYFLLSIVGVISSIIYPFYYVDGIGTKFHIF